MKEFIDRVSSGKKIIKYENGTTETVTIENAEDATVDGTPINRKNLMAIQGFTNRSIIFEEDGSVTEEFENGEKLNTKVINFADITQTFSGKKNITKNLFMVDNIIQEEVK